VGTTEASPEASNLIPPSERILRRPGYAHLWWSSSLQVFQELTEMGHHVSLWSSEGSACAARLLGVEDLVFACFGKAGALPASVDFVVDDQPGMAERYRGFTVLVFGRDKDLLDVPGAVE
jgi:hypothetical protein